MKIAIGNDHVAVDLKNIIKDYIVELGHEVVNVGVDDSKSVDYPVIAKDLCELVTSNRVDFGFLICGTGVGIGIAANKVKGIRAVTCSDTYSAKMSRMHNDANVCCFGSRVVGSELAKLIVLEFLRSDFEGERHQARVDMLNNMI